MSQILVTGATGFIGSHLVEALLARGDSVRCLVRPNSNLRWLPGDRIEKVTANLATGQGLEAALRGVDIVFHLAGATKALSRAEYQQTNVASMHRLLEAIAEWAPQLKRFIYLSSQAAAGPGPGKMIRDETSTCQPITPYGESKLAGEHLLAEYPGLPSVTLRAVSVYGPRDKDFLAIFKSASLGFMPILGRRQEQLAFVHVADVVQALILAAFHPAAAGQTYFVTDGRIYSFEQFRQILEKTLSRKARPILVPLPLLWLIAAAAGTWARLSRIPAILNLNRYREFTETNWGCSSDKLQQELGFQPRYSLEAGLQQTLAWAKQEKWL